MHSQSVIPLEVQEAMTAYETAAVNLQKAVAAAFPRGSEVKCQSSRMHSPAVRTVTGHGNSRNPAYLFIKAPVGKNQELSLNYHLIELVSLGPPHCDVCDELITEGRVDPVSGKPRCEDCTPA